MSVWCGDGDPPDAWQVRPVKARKEHDCDACGVTIRPGDSYTRDALLHEGTWHVVIRCERCQVIYNHLEQRLQDSGSDECCARELDCGHEYRERWGQEPPAWLAQLAFWLPGDPLPATRPCTLLATWSYHAPGYAPACNGQVYEYHRGTGVAGIGGVNGCISDGIRNARSEQDS